MNLYQRSKLSIAQGALTNSKNPSSFVFGVYPTHVHHGQKAQLVLEGGARYIDYICGLGANLFGYGNEKIADAVRHVLYQGWSHSLPTHHEVEASEALKTLFPWVETFKFVKTGTDACSAALRIARNATGRSLVLSEGYHGWSDGFVSLTKPACGVPDQTGIAKLERLEQIDESVAAVIVEPVITDWSIERRRWLEGLREVCSKSGALLIFDEIITGFRFQKHSVAKAFGIEPDLICLGKSIANGLPLSAVGGKYKVMDDPKYFVSSTFAGEILSLVACKAVIDLIKKDTKYDVELLWNLGKRFLDRFNEISDRVKIEGYPSRGVFVGDPLDVALFHQEAAKARILFCKSWFFNWDLAEHTDVVINTCSDILGRIHRGEVQLEGELPQSPFSMKVREK